MVPGDPCSALSQQVSTGFPGPSYIKANHLELRRSLGLGVPSSIDLSPPGHIRRWVIVQICPENRFALLKEGLDTLFHISVQSSAKQKKTSFVKWIRTGTGQATYSDSKV